MGTKSVPEIVESAVAAFLAAQTGLSGVNVYKGIANANTTLPLVVVSCGSVAPAPDIPGDLGNYECSVGIQLFTSADAANALTNHRDRSAVIQGAIQQELSTLKSTFTSQGDGTLYDAEYQSQDSGQGDRALETTLTYKMTMVLPA